MVKSYLSLVLVLLFGAILYGCSENETKSSNNELTWTYTYIKSKEDQRTALKEIIVKNWFVMDSIAKQEGLINSYELIENLNKQDSLEWDFIVAVEYYTIDNYSDIAEEFEKIRKSHKSVKIEGMTFSEVGEVIKSELVKKHN